MSSKVEDLKRNIGTLMLNTIIVLFLINVSSHGKLLEGPVDTTVFEGHHVILMCRTDLHFTVFWYFDGKEIFYGGKISMQYASKFDIETPSTGEYNLLIRNATKWYNGIYTCADDEGEGERRSARLTVADHDSKITEQEPQKTDGVYIAAIVTAVFIVLIILMSIVLGMLYFKRRKQTLNASAHEDKENRSTASKLDPSQKPTQEESGVVTDNLPKTKDIIKNIEKNISKQGQVDAIPIGHGYKNYPVPGRNMVPVVPGENKTEKGEFVTGFNRNYSESLLEDEEKVTETDTNNIDSASPSDGLLETTTSATALKCSDESSEISRLLKKPGVDE